MNFGVYGLFFNLMSYLQRKIPNLRQVLMLGKFGFITDGKQFGVYVRESLKSEWVAETASMYNNGRRI